MTFPAWVRPYLDDPMMQLRRRLAERPGFRLSMYMIATMLFVGGGVVAYLHLPAVPSITWLPLMLVGVVGVPLTVLLSVRRFQLSAHLIKVEYAFPEALKITITSMAANILPLPGGVAVRMLALKRANSTYRDVTVVTVAAAFVWIALALVAAGAGFLLFKRLLLAGLFGFSGMFLLVASVWSLSSYCGAVRKVGELLLVQTLLVLLEALRFWLIAVGLGYDAGVAQYLVLTVSSVVSAVIGFAPGGLGIRELVAAGVAPLVGISAAVGFVVAGLDRLIGIVLIGAAAGWMLLRFGKQTGSRELKQRG